MITLRAARRAVHRRLPGAARKRRRWPRLLDRLRPDRLEVSDRTTLRWTGRWAREHGRARRDGLAREPDRACSSRARLDLPGCPGRRGPRWPCSNSVNRRTARAYQQVMCTTAWAAAEFERIGARNLVRVPLGVDLATVHPARRCQRHCGPRYAAPGQMLLVHCGRLSAEKKPQRSLDALATLRADGLPRRARGGRRRPAARRGWSGGRRAPGCRSRSPASCADRADLAALLASADVAIAPGPAETFGLAALEALACGTPVVVSAESALPEVVGDAGAAVAGEDFAAGVRARAGPAGARPGGPRPGPAPSASAGRRGRAASWPSTRPCGRRPGPATVPR